MTELWVVVVTIAILAAVALPALAGKDRVFSIRTQCANQLRQIGVAVTAYANDNGGYVLSAWPNDWALYRTNNFNQYGIWVGSASEGYDQHFLFPVQTNLLKLVYLAPSMTNGVSTIWCCPSIGLSGLPFYNPNQKQLIIGYGYYGGITWWHPNSGNAFHSLSPVKLGTSKPYWVLADDLVVHYPRASEAWATGNGLASDVPHQRAGTIYPDGGNQLDADGSVHWAKLETMDAVTSEGGAGSGIWDFMYQAHLARDLQAAGAPAGFLNMLNAGGLTPQGLHLLQ